MTLDFQTYAACLVALRARERECQLRGLSTEHWSRAKRRLKASLLDSAAHDMRAAVPAFLRKQAD